MAQRLLAAGAQQQLHCSHVQPYDLVLPLSRWHALKVEAVAHSGRGGGMHRDAPPCGGRRRMHPHMHPCSAAALLERFQIACPHPLFLLCSGAGVQKLDQFAVLKFPLTTESAMKKIEDNNTLVRHGGLVQQRAAGDGPSGAEGSDGCLPVCLTGVLDAMLRFGRESSAGAATTSPPF